MGRLLAKIAGLVLIFMVLLRLAGNRIGSVEYLVGLVLLGISITLVVRRHRRHVNS
jgi:hypothetical protein